MTWQLLLVGLLVCAALLYLARQTWRTLRGSSSGCGGGCKCPTSKTTDDAKPTVVHIPVEQLTLRRRS